MKDQDIVELMMDKLIGAFENNVPKKIMHSEKAPILMYNAVAHLLLRMSEICNIDVNVVKKHIDEIYNYDKSKKNIKIFN